MKTYTKDTRAGFRVCSYSVRILYTFWFRFWKCQLIEFCLPNSSFSKLGNNWIYIGNVFPFNIMVLLFLLFLGIFSVWSGFLQEEGECNKLIKTCVEQKQDNSSKHLYGRIFNLNYSQQIMSWYFYFEFSWPISYLFFLWCNSFLPVTYRTKPIKSLERRAKKSSKW